MIGLIIAGAVLCIILILLLSSLKITLNISDGVTFKITYLGLSVFTQKQNKLTNVLKDYAKGKSRKKVIEDILVILKQLCLRFVKLLKHVRFKKLDFNLTVASEDAATTAIRYGNICSIVYSLCGLLGSACDFDAKKVKVSADFASENMTLVLKSTIKIRLIFLVSFAFGFAFSIIKLKLGELKNGRA